MPVHSETFIHYIQVGDYFIPALTLPLPSKPIGKWGRLYRDFLKNHHPVRYNSLILSGQLWELLAQINEQVQDRLDRTISKMAAAEAATEELKVADPMAWVGAMNNIHSRAEEIVLQELIWEEETKRPCWKNCGTATWNPVSLILPPAKNTRNCCIWSPAMRKSS